MDEVRETEVGTDEPVPATPVADGSVQPTSEPVENADVTEAPVDADASTSFAEDDDPESNVGDEAPETDDENSGSPVE